MCVCWCVSELLLLVCVLAVCVCSCPDPCVCYSELEVHCTFRHLRSVPVVQAAARRVNLGYNSVSGVTRDQFRRLRRLELLMLHGNLIQTIQDGSFRDLQALQVLKLSQNRVQKLGKATFTGLGNLVRLHLDHNRISFIHPESFYGLTRLQLLSLEGNLLRQLHPHTLVSLRLGPFHHRCSLKTVDLSGNRLSTLPRELLRVCPGLEKLFLAANLWSCDCRVAWLAQWMEENPGVLKCNREQQSGAEPLCPVCELPFSVRGAVLERQRFSCSAPAVLTPLKPLRAVQDHAHYAPVSPASFVAPVGVLNVSFTSGPQTGAALACVVQRPSGADHVTLTPAEDGTLSGTVSGTLLCEVDSGRRRQVWATLSPHQNPPLTLQRHPASAHLYRQAPAAGEGLQARVTVSPEWLLQDTVSLRLDLSAHASHMLSITYVSRLHVAAETLRAEPYSWVMIQRGGRTTRSLLVGETLELSCHYFADPEPVLEWILPDNSKLRAPYGGAGERRVVSSGGRLVVKRVERSDAGLYHCVVTNYRDADVMAFRVAVIGADPEGAVQRTGVAAGQELRLDCPAAGSPQPSVHWILPNNTLPDTSRGNLLLHNNGTLVLRGVTARDGGVYRCSAVNFLGADSLNVHVSVLENGAKSKVRRRGPTRQGLGEVRSVTSVGPVARFQNIPGGIREKVKSSVWTRRVFSIAPDPESFLKRPPSNTSVSSETPGDIGDSSGDGDPQDKFMTVTPSETLRHRPENAIKQTEVIRPSSSSAVTPRPSPLFAPSARSDRITLHTGDKRRVTRPGRRRIVRPNKITDIQSRLSRFQSCEKRETNASSLECWVARRTSTERVEASMDQRSLTSGEAEKTQTVRTSERKVSVQQVSTATPNTEITQATSPSNHLRTFTLPTETRSTRPTAGLTASRDPHNPPESSADDSSGLSVEESISLEIEPSSSAESSRITVFSSTESPQIAQTSSVKSRPDYSGSVTIRKATVIPLVHSTSPPHLQLGKTTPAPPTSLVRHTSAQPREPQETVLDSSGEPERAESWVPSSSSADSSDRESDHTTLSPAATSKPKILGGNAASFTVEADSDASLPCSARGAPVPEVSWRRLSPATGAALTLRGRAGRLEVLGNGTLIIRRSSSRDSGQYVCVAESVLGSDSLLLTLSVLSYPPRILETPLRKVSAATGGGVSMACRAEGRPAPLVSWILPDRTEVTGPSSELERVGVAGTGTLSIRGVSAHDEGYYRCMASNPVGAASAVVRLVVLMSPPVALEETPQLLEADAGDHLLLSCSTHGDPRPSTRWTLPDGTTLSPASASVFANGSLHLRSLAASDGGRYECVSGAERHVVTLKIHSRTTAPHITDTSDQRTHLLYGHRLQLDCSAAGNPRPEILWQLPSNATVRQRQRAGPVAVLENGSLVIESVRGRDGGDFRCVARSPVGEDERVLSVSVRMKPRIKPGVGERRVLHGEGVSLDCAAAGVPEPEVWWETPDGGVVRRVHRDGSGRFLLLENGTLHLREARAEEAGLYTCHARNAAGADRTQIRLSVTPAAPRLQHSARVTAGASVRFDCQASGEPKPTLFWRLPSRQVIAASHQRHMVHANGSLGIQGVRLADGGEYVCRAGEESRSYRLQVLARPPVINGFQRNRTVVTDAALKHSRKLIDCRADGSPTPKVTWIMPDNIFLTAPYYGSRISVHHNGTLEIRNVRRSDAAEFICLAQNDGGEAVMLLRLEVPDQLIRPVFAEPLHRRVLTPAGHSVALSCSASGQPTPRIFWTLPNHTRISEGFSGSRYRLSKDGTLLIANCSAEDCGNYRCGAKNPAGYIEKLLVLDVVTQPRGRVRCVAGEPLFLHCLTDALRPALSWSTPRPALSWSTPRGLLLTRSSGRHRLLNNGTLVVLGTRAADGGNYVCRARTEGGGARLVVLVVVVVPSPPRITAAPPPTVRGAAGVPVQLRCLARGVPSPQIRWELPDGPVLSTHVKREALPARILLLRGTMVIAAPTRAHSGSYTCTAFSSAGRDSRTARLTVV